MSIKLGITNIKSIFLGSQKISHVYLGSTPVMQPPPPVTEGWRYIRITPPTMNGHWQGNEVRIFDQSFVNRALASTGTFTPVANNTSNFGSWTGLKDANTTTSSVYWTWGYPLQMNIDLGAIYKVSQIDIFLGTATTNPSQASDIRVSKDGNVWVTGKATYNGNPLTNLQRYAIAL